MNQPYKKGNCLSRKKPIITNRNQAYFAKMSGCGLQEVIFYSSSLFTKTPFVSYSLFQPLLHISSTHNEEGNNERYDRIVGLSSSFMAWAKINSGESLFCFRFGNDLGNFNSFFLLKI